MTRLPNTASLLFAAASLVAAVSAAEQARALQQPESLSWHVRYDTSSPRQISVQGRIAARALADRRSLTLFFVDLPGTSRQVQAVRVTSQARALRVNRRGGTPLTFDIALPSDPSTISIEYQIDPTYFPSGMERDSPADARSRASRDVAVLRTTSLLPVLSLDGVGAYVTFQLPGRWTAITPWEPRRSGYWVPWTRRPRVDYLGVGPFRWQTVLIGGSQVQMGVYGTDGQVTPAQIRDLLRYEVALVGSGFESPGRRSVVVIPGTFMQGGAAGAASAVLAPSAILLAHELFHWWMRADLVSPDARWFTEGFAQYVGIVSAHETGLISEALRRACFADLQAEMRFLESSGSVGLAEASSGYSRDSRSQRLVYSKGALFVRRLDQLGRRRGSGLRAVLRPIFAEPRRGLTSGDLERFVVQAYGQAGSAEYRRFVLAADTLPTSDFGEATGRSGCARTWPR